MKALLLCFFLSSAVFTYAQDSTLKDQKIQAELSNTAPEPENQTDSTKVSVPDKLNIDSFETVVSETRVLPNEGNPYFTLSAGLAPFQISLGLLKYFIPEWWGHLELNLSFFPSVNVENYYTAFSSYSPFVAFKVITGYAFYSFQRYEISLFAQMQFAFISTSDIPFILSLGFRFIFNFFWIDLGASYAISSTGDASGRFQGFHPTVSLGFRF